MRVLTHCNIVLDPACRVYLLCSFLSLSVVLLCARASVRKGLAFIFRSGSGRLFINHCYYLKELTLRKLFFSSSFFSSLQSNTTDTTVRLIFVGIKEFDSRCHSVVIPNLVNEFRVCVRACVCACVCLFVCANCFTVSVQT